MGIKVGVWGPSKDEETGHGPELDRTFTHMTGGLKRNRE